MSIGHRFEKEHRPEVQISVM